MDSRAVVVAALLLGSLVACSAEDRAPDAEWLAGIDGVADVERRAYDDPAQGSYLHVTLDDDLPDAEVRAVAEEITSDAERDLPSIEVDVDGFVAGLPPDSEFERALWLRADGRATSYGALYHSTVSSHPRVVAPADEVAALALAYDAAVPYDGDVRRSHSVVADDGSIGVQWEVSLGLGHELDREAVGQLAAVQERHPGTTGWFTSSGSRGEAAIHLSPDAIGLDELIEGLPSLVDASDFEALEIGWGPARAPYADFAATYGAGAPRAALERLQRLPGVVAYDAGRRAVEVDDLRTFRRAWALVGTTTGAVAEVSLVRGRELYRTQRLFEPPVLTARRGTSAADLAFYLEVGAIEGVRSTAVSTVSGAGHLTLEAEADDEQVDRALAALAALPGDLLVGLFVAVPGDYGRDEVVRVGELGPGGLAADPAPPDRYADVVADLARRVAPAWDRARDAS